MEKISLPPIENSIYVFYYSIPAHIPYETSRTLSYSLPISDQKYLSSIKNINAQRRTLLGRIIVRHIASDLDILESEFINTSPTGKPFFLSSPSINFNISHSADMVVCCLTKSSSIGIDIEKIRPINWGNFQHYFQSDEWHYIHNSDNPKLSFFNLWVRKEALIKADGRGLEINLST